jgi:hypothetical protein
VFVFLYFSTLMHFFLRIVIYYMKVIVCLLYIIKVTECHKTFGPIPPMKQFSFYLPPAKTLGRCNRVNMGV